jgi:uncharacterized metal-binding protein
MVRVRAVPVLFACRGCELDRAAVEAARQLDRRGLGEAEAAGSGADKARSRYPVYAIEGCAEACGKRWLAAQGVEPVASFVLDPETSLGPQLEEIARLLGR